MMLQTLDGKSGAMRIYNFFTMRTFNINGKDVRFVKVSASLITSWFHLTGDDKKFYEVRFNKQLKSDILAGNKITSVRVKSFIAVPEKRIISQNQFEMEEISAGQDVLESV